MSAAWTKAQCYQVSLHFAFPGYKHSQESSTGGNLECGGAGSKRSKQRSIYIYYSKINVTLFTIINMIKSIKWYSAVLRTWTVAFSLAGSISHFCKRVWCFSCWPGQQLGDHFIFIPFKNSEAEVLTHIGEEGPVTGLRIIQSLIHFEFLVNGV